MPLLGASDQDPVLSGAKDQRIHELRAALTAVMADRASLQRELAVAREEGGAEVEAQVAHVRMLEVRFGEHVRVCTCIWGFSCALDVRSG